VAEQSFKTVQCIEEDQAKIAAAAEMLRWTIPQVVRMLTDALDILLEAEETVDQRRERMLGKLGAGTTGVRQVSNRTRTPVAHQSNNGVTPIEVAS
jgi:hypothetical protein